MTAYAEAENGRVVRDATTELAELRALQQQLREAHEVAGLASWEWQADGEEVLLFHAPAGAEASGPRMTRDELLSRMPPDDRDGVLADLAAMRRGECDEACRRTRFSFSGGERWLETRSRAVRAADGRLISVRGTSQDVTERERGEQRLTGARDFFQATLDSLPSCVAVLDVAGAIVMVNRAWHASGDDVESCLGRIGQSYFAAHSGDPDDWVTRAAAGLKAIIAGGQPQFSMEYRRDVGGRERWFLLRAARYEGPGDARLVIAHDDITQRRIAERQVATQARLLDEVGVAVIATDVGRRVTHWNRGAERLYGWTLAETLGGEVGAFVVPEDDDEAAAVRAELQRTDHWAGEFTVRRKDGSTFPAEVRNRVMRNEQGEPTGAVGVSLDISPRVEQERSLRSTHDYMRAVADSMGQGLFTLDADGGVRYLNQAAEALLGWGNDELLGRPVHETIHCPEGPTLRAGPSPILGALRDGAVLRVDDDVFLRRDGQPVPVAFTAAAFEAGDGELGCVVLFDDISARKRDEALLRAELDKLPWIGRIRDALAEDRFVLHAQPIIDLRTGLVVQQELLLRMRRSDGTLTPPGDFLPVAEEFGLIGEIDRWVIRRAIEIAAAGAPVELNLSAHSMSDASTFEHIERCLAITGADPALLVFEITETALLEDEAAAHLLADRLHAIGSKIALDDFGTGYGGLTYLKHLPIDFVKVDAEFVRDLVDNRASGHVVRAVVALAHDFGMRTVAEGVEDGPTLELLCGLGVDCAQGHHIARPAPVAGDAVA